jgi:hypothetical protein
MLEQLLKSEGIPTVKDNLSLIKVVHRLSKLKKKETQNVATTRLVQTGLSGLDPYQTLPYSDVTGSASPASTSFHS